MSIDLSIRDLKLRFEAVANKDRAAEMEKYMKNNFPFLGIPTPKRREIQKDWLSKNKGSNAFELAKKLWQLPEREYQYVGLDLIKKIKISEYKEKDLLSIKYMITHKSWWDTVDLLASHNVGFYFLKFPEFKDEIIKDWRNSNDLWLKRSTLLFQLKYKEATDFELLINLIDQYKGEQEFFIQKAIGWALRQYSKTNPESVKEFVNQRTLSTVANREAMKYL